MDTNLIQKVKEKANELALQMNVTIEEVNWINEAGNDILQVLCDAEGGFNIDQATSLNEALSAYLDTIDDGEDEYYLEVSSIGAEKVLKNDTDIEKAIGDYVHVDYINPYEIIKGTRIKDIEGNLISNSDANLVIEVNLKGRIKKVEVEKENIKLIRKAIKF